MSQFQVCCELDALSGRDITVGHKDHISDRSAGENDTADELTDKIDTTMLICYSHDNTDRYKEHGAYSESKK